MRVTTRFGFHSTAEDVLGGVDLLGKRAIVTGGGADVGLETARTLALVRAQWRQCGTAVASFPCFLTRQLASIALAG